MNEAAPIISDRDDFLKQLVAIPSLSGEEQEVARLLVRTMQSAGFCASVDEAGNAVGVREEPGPPGTPTRELILLGHMDTVPGAIPVRMEDGMLFGRGAVDAKGPLAAFVMAAAQATIPPGTRVVVIGAVEEESSSSRGARHIAGQYKPDACIIGEPGGWDGITIGYKGRLLLAYVLSRDMGHSAGQQSGVAEAAIAWWNGLAGFIQQYNAPREKLFDQLIPAIRELRLTSDGLRDTIRLEAGIRLPPDYDPEHLLGLARDFAGDATVSAHGHEPAWQSPRTSPLVTAFSAAIRARGAQPRVKRKTGTCDMNVVGPVWQCPIIAYGPGDSLLDHTPREHIILGDYHRSIGILVHVIERLFVDGKWSGTD